MGTYPILLVRRVALKFHHSFVLVGIRKRYVCFKKPEGLSGLLKLIQSFEIHHLVYLERNWGSLESVKFMVIFSPQDSFYILVYIY